MILALQVGRLQRTESATWTRKESFLRGRLFFCISFLQNEKPPEGGLLPLRLVFARGSYWRCALTYQHMEHGVGNESCKYGNQQVTQQRRYVHDTPSFSLRGAHTFLWEFLANFFIYDIIFIYIIKKEGALCGTDGKRKF